jgi:hypothetical protein
MTDDLHDLLHDAAGPSGEPDIEALRRRGSAMQRRRLVTVVTGAALGILGVGAIVATATAAGDPQTARVSTDKTTTSTVAKPAERTTTTSRGLPVLTSPTTTPPVTVPPNLRSTLPSTTTSTTTRPATTPQAPPATDTIHGSLVDGRPWSLRHDADHGLCTVIGNTDFGCDDEGPVLSPDADPATPRLAVEGHGFPFDQLGVLVYAYLPSGATKVVVEWDGGRESAHGLVVEPGHRFWGIPVRQGDNPDRVSYRTDDGHEVRNFPLSGHS